MTVRAVASLLEVLPPSRRAGCGRFDEAELRLRGLCPQCVDAVRQLVPVTWSISVPGTDAAIPALAAAA
jgi:hypothetical protein